MRPPSAMQRQELLGQEEGALEVDVHELVELRLGRLGEARVDADAGVVDQEVEAVALPSAAASAAAHRLGEGGEARAVADVELQRHRLAALGLDLPRRRAAASLAPAAIGEDDVDAAVGEVERHALAEAAAAAGDECDLGSWASEPPRTLPPMVPCGVVKPLLVFQHVAVEHPGILREFLREDGFAWRAVESLDAGEAIPDLRHFSALVVMGGPMDVWEEDLHPWLRDEKAAIREAVAERGMPVLGVCLGHQLLAEALGGEVGKASRPEVGFHEVELTEAGRKSDFLAGLPERITCAPVARRRGEARARRRAGARLFAGLGGAGVRGRRSRARAPVPRRDHAARRWASGR